MPKIEQNINVFRGAICSGSDNDLPPEHCSEQSDMVAEQDSIKTRPGFVKKNTTALAGGILGLFDYRRKTGQYSFLWSAGGNIYDDLDVYTVSENSDSLILTKTGAGGRKELGGFANPGGIYYDADSEFCFVTNQDIYDTSIVKTKIDGTGWEKFGSRGAGANQFKTPRGLHYDSATEFIYIADSYNSRIVKTKIDGTGWETSIWFSYPVDVYYDVPTDFCYIVESGYNRIVKTKMDGTGRVNLGSYGSGESQFNSPRGIYYDSATEFIYVADRTNHRIVKTKIDGSGWETYGSQGDGVGEFNQPRGIFYDSGLIYVADRINCRIVKTKMDGSVWEVTKSVVGPSDVYYSIL